MSGGLYGVASAVLSALLVVVGVAMVATTLARGGGPLATGVLLGLLFALAGGGRLYVGWRR